MPSPSDPAEVKVKHALSVIVARARDSGRLEKWVLDGCIEVLREAEGKPVRNMVSYVQVLNHPRGRL